MTLNNLATLKQSLWEMDSALALSEEVLRAQRRLYPAGHERVAMAANNLAFTHLTLGDYAAAERGFRESVEILERLYGATHITTLIGRNNVGRALLLRARRPKPRAFFETSSRSVGIIRSSASRCSGSVVRTMPRDGAARHARRSTRPSRWPCSSCPRNTPGDRKPSSR